MSDGELEAWAEAHAPAGSPLAVGILRLLDDRNRLKRGELNAEEFNNLCHDLHTRQPPCSREVFNQGCLAFQDILFPPEVPARAPAGSNFRFDHDDALYGSPD